MAEHMGSNKNSAIAFLEMLETGKVEEGFRRFVSTSFRHHHAGVKGDAESLRTWVLKENAEHPTRMFEVKHALEDRDFVAVHSRLRLAPGEPDYSVVHLFRFVAIRIVELWAIREQTPVPNTNEHGMF